MVSNSSGHAPGLANDQAARPKTSQVSGVVPFTSFGGVCRGPDIHLPRCGGRCWCLGRRANGFKMQGQELRLWSLAHRMVSNVHCYVQPACAPAICASTCSDPCFTSALELDLWNRTWCDIRYCDALPGYADRRRLRGFTLGTIMANALGLITSIVVSLTVLNSAPGFQVPPLWRMFTAVVLATLNFVV